jgi:hypothetical protein
MTAIKVIRRYQPDPERMREALLAVLRAADPFLPPEPAEADGARAPGGAPALPGRQPRAVPRGQPGRGDAPSPEAAAGLPGPSTAAGGPPPGGAA